MYADDTSITLGGEDAYQLLENLRNELQDVTDWLRQNKLSLNVAKCEFMFLGNSKQSVILRLEKMKSSELERRSI